MTDRQSAPVENMGNASTAVRSAVTWNLVSDLYRHFGRSHGLAVSAGVSDFSANYFLVTVLSERTERRLVVNLNGTSFHVEGASPGSDLPASIPELGGGGYVRMALAQGKRPLLEATSSLLGLGRIPPQPEKTDATALCVRCIGHLMTERILFEGAPAPLVAEVARPSSVNALSKELQGFLHATNQPTGAPNPSTWLLTTYGRPPHASRTLVLNTQTGDAVAADGSRASLWTLYCDADRSVHAPLAWLERHLGG